MRFRTKFSKLAELLFRLGLAALFLYFGVLALIQPEVEASIWIGTQIQPIIVSILPLTTFMLVLGAVQVLVGIILISGKYLRIGLLVAAGLLIGIIINLGFNDIALRDLALLTGVIYLYSQQ